MAIDSNTIIIGAGVLLLLFAMLVFSTKGNKVAKLNKTGLGFFFLILGAGLIAMQMGYLANFGASPLSAGSTGESQTTTLNTPGASGYQPTATYSAKDLYANTAISGTSYYKRGTNRASTSIISNTNPGETITYWVDNATFWVAPVSATAISGVTDLAATGYANGTATITGYDLVNRASTTNGAYNTSMGANKQANIEITYQGTNKQSAMPFGGLMVIEANASIASISCNGDDLLSSNPYHLTYTTSLTSHSYRVFAVSPTIDTGLGAVKKISCQFNNGAAAAGAGTTYYVKFIPANYYVSQTGEILLDTEKFADGATTRVGSNINLPQLNGFWGA